MPKYHVWTIGCQMNKAETREISDYLESLGYAPAARPDEADLVILNTCVVRQSAERKVTGTLSYLKGIKKPGQKVMVTGCFVDSHPDDLKKRYPQVDLFFKPGQIEALRQWIAGSGKGAAPNLLSPPADVTAYVPIIQGCDNFCSYCIVPFRRGREKSRPPDEIICEVERLVRRGVREVTLVGQNVDSYGHDLPGKPDLASLLGKINGIDGLWRIRFLTNHPKDMSDRLIEAMAGLDKVCEQINLPAQSGDNDILKAMRRGYTIEHYRELVSRIRTMVPGIAVSTDLIVGFPGETEEQFQHTLDLVRELRFDSVFCAMYSPRPETLAARHYEDSVPHGVKEARHRAVEELQTQIATAINAGLLGRPVEVLVEGKKSGKWCGRTRTNKLVFFPSETDCFGRLVNIEITNTGPWHLSGKLQEG
jgi:tRNA-2-methylthio-N6-dimethylallyladenosine synthase